MSSLLRSSCSEMKRWFAPFAVLLLSLSLAGQSQQVNRTLSGTVRGKSGLPIANAVVSVRKTNGTDTKVVATKGNGVYTLPGLLAGSYEITVSAPGYATSRTVVRLRAASDRVLNFTLQLIGSFNAKENANSANVRDLPLNGRSAADVATLEPGVTTARTQASGEAQRGFGTQMTISGARPRQNDYRLDGISLNDYANGPPGSALGVSLGVDAVEQFSVLTSNYPAQHGRSSGGIISASTRSGTSEFHGSVYEFFRNSALDARNFFDTKKPPFRRNQFGGSLGGQIQKDRTFIFGDYEGLRSSRWTACSADARAGNLSSGQITVDPNVLSFVNAFYPLPNGPPLGAGDTGIFTFSG